MNAAAYLRVSTGGQSPETQRMLLLAEIGRRDWTLTGMRQDTKSGKNTRRPELRALLEEMDAGQHDVLMTSRLDRLTRSTGDFAELLTRAKRNGWRIVCLDPNVDMTTPYGEAMAGVAAVFAQLERALISQRQKESIAARRAAGTYAPAGNAVSRIGDDVRLRVAQLMTEDMGRNRIAQRLTLEGYPSPGGGAWSPNTVRSIIDRVRASSSCPSRSATARCRS